MKSIKYTLLLSFILLFGLSYTRTSAQVIRVYSGEHNNKFYTSDIDSIVSLPEMRWNCEINTENFSRENDVIKAHLKINFEPDADSANLVIRESDSYQIITEQPIPTSTTNYIFSIPDSTKSYFADLRSFNKWHNFQEGRFTTTINYKDSNWTQWISTKAGWVNAGNKADEWPLSESESTCSYTYVNFWAGTDPGLPISYRQSKIDPTQGQFRVQNCMYGIDLILDYNTQTHVITVEPQWTGETYSSYGDVWITDAVNYKANIAANKADLSATHTSTYDPETGLFNVYMAYYVSAGCFGYDAETIQVDGFYIPDYSIDISYINAFKGTENDNGYVKINAILGADAQNVQAYVVNKDDDADAVAEEMLNGSIATTRIEHSGEIDIPIGNLEGNLMLVVASIANNTIKSIKSIKFEYYSINPWVSLGKGLYTDDLVSPLFYDTWSATDATYEVEILKNTKTGNYRIMNPYSNSVYPFANNDCAEEGRYIEINAEDPEGVYIEQQDLGFDWGYGPMSICSYGGYLLENYDFATLKAGGYFGKVVDNKILFPSSGGSDMHYQAIIFLGSSAYYTGRNNKFEITLPAGVTASARKAAQFATTKAKIQQKRRIVKDAVEAAKLPSEKKPGAKHLKTDIKPLLLNAK